MKLTFTFTDTPDLPTLTRDYRYLSSLVLPDSVLQIPDCQERLLTIGHLVEPLTHAVLHLTCKELELKDYPLKLVRGEFPKPIWKTWHDLSILFSCPVHRAEVGFLKKQDIKIWLPVRSAFTEPYWQETVVSPTSQGNTEAERSYIQSVQTIAEQCLVLLNAEPTIAERERWRYGGFVPYRYETATFTRVQKLNKKRLSEQREQEKQEQKRKAREEKQAQKLKESGKTPAGPPQTGAGRRVGAVPGVFKGVTFRSQLEIRFVTQLEAKNIRWIYEGERLGEGQYLVDFYLPDLQCWVEVKGRMEPRDDYLLKEVADYLKRERGERLFIYTQQGAFSVTTNSFRKLTHEEFWTKL